MNVELLRMPVSEKALLLALGDLEFLMDQNLVRGVKVMEDKGRRYYAELKRGGWRPTEAERQRAVRAAMVAMRIEQTAAGQQVIEHIDQSN